MAKKSAAIQVIGAGFTARQLRKMPVTMKSDLNDINEAWIRKIASQASENAPVDTGYLAGTLTEGVEKESDDAWVMKDGTEYTLKQEYTNRSKRAFIRRAIWANEKGYIEAVRVRAKGGG